MINFKDLGELLHKQGRVDAQGSLIHPVPTEVTRRAVSAFGAYVSPCPKLRALQRRFRAELKWRRKHGLEPQVWYVVVQLLCCAALVGLGRVLHNRKEA